MMFTFEKWGISTKYNTILLKSIVIHIVFSSKITMLYFTIVVRTATLGFFYCFTDEEVYAAAKLANADHFITHLENGYQTMLTADGAEDGTSVTLYNLSGTIVRQATLQGGSISLAGLQRGVYAVQLGKLGSTLIRL